MKWNSEYRRKRKNFARSHFREPTERQVMKRWTKDQFILGLQKSIVEMPNSTPQERKVRLNYLETWGKATGVFVPEAATTTSNNVIFVTKEENKEAWAQQALKQQNALRIKTKMATDTGVDSRDSG